MESARPSTSQYRANEPFLVEKLEQAKAEAIERMLEKAETREANAVVGLRIQSVGIYNGSAGTQAFTIYAYGTAVITRLRA